MATLFTDNIGPRKPTQDITLGTTGETITFPGNDLRVNTFQDKGGNTLWTSDGSGTLSSVNAGLKGNLNLLSTQTPSGVSSVSFTSGIDSTYDVYMFTFVDIGVSTDSHFSFQVSTNGGSSYGVNITSTFFRAAHNESGSWTGLNYMTAFDLAQSVAVQTLANSIEDDADASAAGTLYLFKPSSTTYMKHWYSTMQMMQFGSPPLAQETFVAGYVNTTTAVNAIQFSLNTGTFSGTLKLYGLS